MSVLSILGHLLFKVEFVSLGGHVKMQIVGHTSRASSSLGLWWDLGTCISHMFCGVIDADVLRTIALGQDFPGYALLTFWAR